MYHQEVEKLRSSLVALDGDFYVDEDERLRERISDLFLQISNYPGTPSQSQLERVKVLSMDLAEVEKQYQALSNEKLQHINQLLAKHKLEEVKVLSKQEFLENKSSGSGAGGELRGEAGLVGFFALIDLNFISTGFHVWAHKRAK